MLKASGGAGFAFAAFVGALWVIYRRTRRRPHLSEKFSLRQQNFALSPLSTLLPSTVVPSHDVFIDMEIDSCSPERLRETLVQACCHIYPPWIELTPVRRVGIVLLH